MHYHTFERFFPEVMKLLVDFPENASFAIQAHFFAFAECDVEQITALCKLCKNSL